jgi:Flp pilus assembly pilin Flp
MRHDQDGVTVVEFGFIAPILLLLVMGVFDMGHTQFTSALVNGAMQKAGRDLTLENAGSSQNAIDASVIQQVRNVVPASANIELEKLSHYDFEDIGEEEEFTDGNNDGICNNGEPFVDANNNGQWDANRGAAGIGGARDAVLYTAIVSYERLFPMYGLAGLPQEVKIRASTVLRNQPYDAQTRTNTVGNCNI